MDRSSLQHDETSSDTAPIGVALIGSGLFAKDQHLPAILANPTLTLKAVYSRTLSSASALTNNLPHKIDWYTDETADSGRGYPDLLSNPNIKAVIIALPILAQPPFIRQALEAGKHVLSEKPIAADTQTARELISHAHELSRTESGTGQKGTWTVAENYRCKPSHAFARQKIAELGRILGFSANVHSLVKPGGKYYETAWRKVPGYQGGFLLDGGIHYLAGLRYLLGPEDAVERVSAFSGQLREHLAPVDTVDAIFRTGKGVSGTVSISFGTSFRGSGFAVACEGGVVRAMRDRVVVEVEGREEVFDFVEEGPGVREEVEAWVEGIGRGKVDARLRPEEGLADLELLEALLRSGEAGGVPFDVKTS